MARLAAGALHLFVNVVLWASFGGALRLCFSFLHEGGDDVHEFSLVDFTKHVLTREGWSYMATLQVG